MLAKVLGIPWDGSFYEGKPKGNFTSKQAELLDLMLSLDDVANIDLATDPIAQKIKTKITGAQWSAIQAYQQDLRADRDDRLLEVLTKDFLKLVFHLGENGQPLTAANLKPWRDKVKAASGK